MPPTRSRPRTPLLLLALATAAALAIFVGWALTRADAAQAQEDGPVVQLYAGWNNVAYQGIALPLPAALGDAHEDVPVVWQFHAPTQAWNLWSLELPPTLRSVTALEPGGVYFLLSLRERAWSQPLTPPPPPPPQPEPEPKPAPAAALWQITFTRTTVLFALEETIAFDETGQGTVQADGVSAATTVEATPLASVDEILRGNDFFAAWPANTRSGCVSCFRYAIAITPPTGAAIHLETDDLGLSGQLFQLVNQLTSILITRLP